jgi:hypothetical protein
MFDRRTSEATSIDNPLLFSIMYSKLEGKAFEFSREAVYAYWPALKTALQRKFFPSRSVTQLQQELAQMKQTTTAEKYGERPNKTLKSLRRSRVNFFYTISFYRQTGELSQLFTARRVNISALRT